MDNFFVVTGGPGSGKSSLIQTLADQGASVMAEAGRAIIQDHAAIGSPAVPWGDRASFAAMMLCWDLRSYREAHSFAGPIVFDRGIPDVIGYLKLCGLSVPPHLWRAARQFRYNRHVFIADHWPAIYRQDAERRQSPEEAIATCDMMRSVYADLGYELVPLPFAGVADRAAFIWSWLYSASHSKAR